MQPTSSRDIIASLLEADEEDIVSKRTMNRLLQREGFYFGQGRAQNVVMTGAIMSLRVKYVREKIANRDDDGLPILPELFG